MNPILPRLRNGALLVSLALLLGACGSSNDRPHVVEPPPTGTNPPTTPPADSFFTLVAQRVAALLDNDEPVATDSITATAPENTEPEPLPSN